MNTEQPTPTAPRAVGRIDQAIAELAAGILGLATLQASALDGTAYRYEDADGWPTVAIDCPLETLIVRITRE